VSQNISNSSTRLHESEEDNGTGNRRKNCKCERAFTLCCLLLGSIPFQTVAQRDGSWKVAERNHDKVSEIRGRLHGRVVPAKRVDSLCRVDPLPICIVYYFDISITCKASCPALPGPRLQLAESNSLSWDRNCPHIPCNFFLPSWPGKAGWKPHLCMF
jgi:hypothetical protein